MIEDKYYQIIKDILNNNTKENQVLQAIQEMSELTKELTKNIGNGGTDNKMDITLEIADVIIMLTQLVEIYDIDSEKLQGAIEYKVLRQRERMEKENEYECIKFI